MAFDDDFHRSYPKLTQTVYDIFWFTVTLKRDMAVTKIILSVLDL